MKIKVSEYTLLATTKCKKDFCCLRGDQEFLCEIAGSNGHHTVAIKSQPTTSCNYLMHLGSSTYCLCPIRNEIYHSYKK